MDSVTEDYRCLVIKKSALSNRVEDCVFWYKAEVRGKFVMGSKAYWQKHYDRYDQNWDDAVGSDDEDGANNKGLGRVDFVRNNKKRGGGKRAKYTAKVRMVGL